MRNQSSFAAVVASSGTILVLLAMAGLASGTVAGPAAPPAPVDESTASPAAATVFVNITATSSFSFVPSSFTVAPGDSVHLIITQAADFEHTFTLSSVANATIPSSDTPAEVAAFFNAHPPLVNISLGSTAGAEFPVTFTAPSTSGTYEFVCLIHFPEMVGAMTDSNSAPPVSGSSGLSPLELAAIGAVVAIVVIVAAVVVVRRRRKPA